MSAAPLVSVVIPTRNSARTLDACLRSVSAQTYPAVELVVVDNASSDDTVMIARRHADLVLQAGRERCAQRNAGIAAARGEFVLVGDADMTLSPDVVASCIARCGSGDAVAIDRIACGSGFWSRCKAFESTLYHGDRVVSAARFFRRAALLDAGGYDETLLGGDDWDASMRVLRGRQLVFADALMQNDEGRVSLRERFVKQLYYGQSWPRFVRKHGAGAMRRLNPARGALVRGAGKMLRHPVLGVGLVILKAVELSGTVLGVALGRWIPHDRLYGR
ncbi:MAG TPA: glycosyltransferase family A protein [Candidatus Dormibacteraeota bacterium]|nr:glycosyltransferase family A protein [Candidatus Dormibacteraeota bacterium]